MPVVLPLLQKDNIVRQHMQTCFGGITGESVITFKCVCVYLTISENVVAHFKAAGSFVASHEVPPILAREKLAEPVLSLQYRPMVNSVSLQMIP